MGTSEAIQKFQTQVQVQYLHLLALTLSQSHSVVWEIHHIWIVVSLVEVPNSGIQISPCYCFRIDIVEIFTNTKHVEDNALHLLSRHRVDAGFLSNIPWTSSNNAAALVPPHRGCSGGKNWGQHCVRHFSSTQQMEASSIYLPVEIK